MIPNSIKIRGNELPDAAGVYLYFDEHDQILYVGKATSIKKRVNSYFSKAHNNRIADMVSKIARIDFILTPTVIEALVLEANKVREFRPPYNILLKDDKSFLYLVITNEDYPRPLLVRAHELEREGIKPFESELSVSTKKKYKAIYGPYTSGYSLKIALELVRNAIPWSICESPSVTGKNKPCFDAQIHKCPGVCSGVISKQEYKKVIRDLMLFFEGKKKQIIREMLRRMKTAAKEERFEEAQIIKRKVFALEHIQDIALITKADFELPFAKPEGLMIDLDSRIEAYDISNISGEFAVGSMVVFEGGKPAKDKYRKFKIKTVKGSNDVAMVDEIIRRRLHRVSVQPKAWELPQIMIIDGGKPQVNRVESILREFGLNIPVIGIAKGFDRKQDELIFDGTNLDLARVAVVGKELFQKARDEAHRFAVAYHRKLRSKR